MTDLCEHLDLDFDPSIVAPTTAYNIYPSNPIIDIVFDISKVTKNPDHATCTNEPVISIT